ncbi:MAG: acyl-CoA dehydrogenase [Frankiales bacterium]|nr:acyl-CoA dehydrogenase [Frankiales bacterium]
MDLTVTPEMTALREVVASFFARKNPISTVRELLADERGYDSKIWLQLAEQVGAQGLLIPEAYGGAGGSLREAAIVLEEAGHSLWGGPLLASSVLATVALLEGADEAARAEWLPQLADGSVVATLVTALDRPLADAVPSVGVDAGGATLSGAVRYVLDAHLADLLVVPVDVDGRTDLALVSPGAPGLTVELLPNIDLTRRLCSVSFAGTPATIVGTDVASGLARALTAGATAVGADQLGLLRAMVELAVGYAGIRKQFGVHIGSFQAVQHLCVDLFVAQESAAALVAAAAAAEPEEATELTHVLQAYTSEATPLAGETALHLHGGIGYTWEHDIHLFLRRAKLDEALLGDSASHRQALADLLGLA